ncbi:MAG: threonylcarbamoyl-AMP synthase [Candidatus Diapherotrites archaeon]|nr:threonylcarbamoyl-AMP synthase [Candidatus Diapherotrites archaeon]
MTIILKINERYICKKKLKVAADAIKKGQLVVFPTETVYGLGASAYNPKACKKIFEVKGRPADNPLIVHVANIKQAKKIAEFNPIARKLAKLWPAPLTLVLRKKDKKIPKIVTAGLDTIAIRIPRHRVALELIKASRPIAAPSANISGTPSGTTLRHIIDDFFGKVSVIIDSGIARYGLESTIVDLSRGKAILLRPGSLPAEKISKIVELEIPPEAKALKKAKKAIAPGMKYRHYSPSVPVIVVENEKEKNIKRIAEEYKQSKLRVALIASKNYAKLRLFKKFKTERHFAKHLFAWLRFFDKKSDVIIVEAVKEHGLGLAIMNRLRKAATKII